MKLLFSNANKNTWKVNCDNNDYLQNALIYCILLNEVHMLTFPCYHLAIHHFAYIVCQSLFRLIFILIGTVQSKITR